MDNTPGDKLGVWRDMRLADDALVEYFLTVVDFSASVSSDLKALYKSVIIIIIIITFKRFKTISDINIAVKSFLKFTARGCSPAGASNIMPKMLHFGAIFEYC